MSVICRAPVAPVNADASLRAEQVTQLVLGETATVLERRAEWLRVRADIDSYEGWVHRGYVLSTAQAPQWREAATGWSDGAVVQVNGHGVRLPLRSRVILEGNSVQLPGDRVGAVVEGSVRDAAAVRRSAENTTPDEWAWVEFGGAPYQWGGVTPLGVDCSGMIQTTFAARGVSLPRDGWQQAAVGSAVPPESLAAGDLCFFRGETTERITHVAIYAGDDVIVHSTVACGEVVRESWGEGMRAAALRERFVSARRVR
jgi:cell wall-associated NlpC family hydrolase